MPLVLLASLLMQGPLAAAGQAVQEAAPTTGQLRAAVQQPIEDAGLIRKVAPPVVLAAAAAPYDEAWAGDCAHIAADLVVLDAALGPDVDQPAPRPGARGVVMDVIKGALNLPYDSVVRQLSGAERRDRAYRRAVLAAVARRGFLKGRASVMKCAPATPPTAAASSAPAAAP